MSQSTIVIGADHRGFSLKSKVYDLLRAQGHTVIDCGTEGENSCDAGDYAQNVAAELKKNSAYIGILICGSGQAMAMTANRYKHIRAALCMNTTMARLAREHNDANVLVIGAHVTGEAVALDTLDTFLKTKFGEGRFTARRDKLTAIGGL